MNYIKEFYDDKKCKWEEVEIDKKEAIRILSCFYSDVEELLLIPNYYRTPFGGIKVVN